MQIVTGYKGESHITSNDVQGFNQGAFGSDSYILYVGNKFDITAVSANEFRISDGEGVHQGVHFRVDPGTYDTVTIDSGTQSTKRIDRIVARYTRNTQGVESMNWVVIKGEPTYGDTPEAPSITSGDILAGDTTADMLMFEITLDGVNVESAVKTKDYIHNISLLTTEYNNVNGSLNEIRYIESDTVSYTFAGITGTLNIKKYGRTRQISGSIGNGTAFSSATGSDTICTLPDGHKPVMTTYATALARSSGGWAGATYTPVGILINTNGTISINGNASALQGCQYITFNAVYMCDRVYI